VYTNFRTKRKDLEVRFRTDHTGTSNVALLVDVATMSNSHDRHGSIPVIDLVKNAVVAYSNSPFGTVHESSCFCWTWIVWKSSYGGC